MEARDEGTGDGIRAGDGNRAGDGTRAGNGTRAGSGTGTIAGGSTDNCAGTRPVGGERRGESWGFWATTLHKNIF